MEQDVEPLEARVALIIFSRAPKPGQSKTRLATVVGEHAASAFHAVCLRDLMRLQAELSARLAKSNPPVELDTYIFHPPGDDLTHFAQAGVNLPPLIHGAKQSGDTMGERMAHAIQTVLDGSPAGTPALLIGSDVPLLEMDDLAQALEALKDADVVLGPSSDGGYYLIGLTQPRPGLFALKDWSTPTVLEQTIEKAKVAGWKLAMLETLPDVDTAEDLEKVRNHPRADTLQDREGVRMTQVLAMQVAAKAGTESAN